MDLIKEFDRLFKGEAIPMPTVFSFDTIPSTNTAAREYFEKNNPTGGTYLFFSRSQSAGRGTRGRSFESPEGGLYLSLLFTERLFPEDLQRITVAAAVAVCKTLNRLFPNLGAKIKWVNDITVSDRKISGILAESALADGGQAKYIILGIGINISGGHYSPEVEKIKTSLAENNLSISPESLCAEITHALLSMRGTDWSDIISSYRKDSALIGRHVKILRTQGSISATATAINEDGTLVCRLESGESFTLSSGDVSVRADNTYQ